MANDLRTFAERDLRQHVRVARQDLALPGGPNSLPRALPPLPGFRQDYVGGFAILDWDHKMPSNAFTLRLFGFYSNSSLARGERSYESRVQEIERRDRFPEFDVPDFDSLFADDAYECEFTTSGHPSQCRLTSGWRRQIAKADAVQAVAIAEASSEYQTLITNLGARPSHLGELEAVSWTPPCEGDHANWALEVWYLLSFDGRIGSGKGFLVNLDNNSVLSMKDFSVRTG